MLQMVLVSFLLGIIGFLGHSELNKLRFAAFERDFPRDAANDRTQAAYSLIHTERVLAVNASILCLEVIHTLCS